MCVCVFIGSQCSVALWEPSSFVTLDGLSENPPFIHIQIHLHHNNSEMVSLLYRWYSVFNSTVIRGTLQPPAGLTSLFTSAWQIVCCVLARRNGNALSDPTRSDHSGRNKLVSQEFSAKRPSASTTSEWQMEEYRGPLAVFKLGIPLWSIRDKCQNWYLVCTSSTSCLCQLMKQQEVCWVMALFYSYKVTRTKLGETLKISCSLLNLSNRFCWKGIFEEPLLARLIILTWT